MYEAIERGNGFADAIAQAAAVEGGPKRQPVSFCGPLRRDIHIEARRAAARTSDSVLLTSKRGIRPVGRPARSWIESATARFGVDFASESS